MFGEAVFVLFLYTIWIGVIGLQKAFAIWLSDDTIYDYYPDFESTEFKETHG